MSKFKNVISIFNELPVGGFITRSMYMSLAKYRREEATFEYYRCVLMRAGYLYDPTTEKQPFPCGVYFKAKKIPTGITLTELKKEAYPKSNGKRLYERMDVTTCKKRGEV